MKTTIQMKQLKAAANRPSLSANPVSIWEHEGKVHFRDDVSKREATVSVTRWCQFWENVTLDLSSLALAVDGKTYWFIDRKNESILAVTIFIEKDSNYKIECRIGIYQFELDENFEKVSIFTEGLSG